MAVIWTTLKGMNEMKNRVVKTPPPETHESSGVLVTLQIEGLGLHRDSATCQWVLTKAVLPVKNGPSCMTIGLPIEATSFLDKFYLDYMGWVEKFMGQLHGPEVGTPIIHAGSEAKN